MFRDVIINLLFSSSFSSAELAALEPGGVPVPRRPDELNKESPELHPCGVTGTRKYLKSNERLEILGEITRVLIIEVPR